MQFDHVFSMSRFALGQEIVKIGDGELYWYRLGSSDEVDKLDRVIGLQR